MFGDPQTCGGWRRLMTNRVDRNHCLQLACRAARRWTCETRLTATTVQVSTACCIWIRSATHAADGWGLERYLLEPGFPISPFRAIQHPGAIRPTIGSLNLTPRSRASPPGALAGTDAFLKSAARDSRRRARPLCTISAPGLRRRLLKLGCCISSRGAVTKSFPCGP